MHIEVFMVRSPFRRTISVVDHKCVKCQDLSFDKSSMDRGSSVKGDASETREIDALHSISEILQTGLNKRTITIIADLIKSGIEPESLVDG